MQSVKLKHRERILNKQKWTLIDNLPSRQISMIIQKKLTKTHKKKILKINTLTILTVHNFTTTARKLSKTLKRDSSTSPLKWWTTMVPTTLETIKRSKTNSKVNLRTKSLLLSTTFKMKLHQVSLTTQIFHKILIWTNLM